jgi:hypothetical protein
MDTGERHLLCLSFTLPPVFHPLVCISEEHCGLRGFWGLRQARSKSFSGCTMASLLLDTQTFQCLDTGERRLLCLSFTLPPGLIPLFSDQRT